MSGSYYMTEEGFNKIKAELSELINVERIKISRQIGEARDKGDLSENAEYDAAKEAQGLLELRISKLETKMRNAKIIKPEQIDHSKVQILTKVTLKNLKTDATVVYLIVPDGEANFKENKISVLTPISKGLLGKVIGDVVDVVVPAGTLNFEILDIASIG